MTTAPRPSPSGRYDLCVIGGGAAGLLLVSALRDAGLRICVLESGDDAFTPHADGLKAVESHGLVIKHDSRERRLGGATNTWNGLCAPLDEVDFDQDRPGAWPISRAELLPYYAEASAYGFPAPASFDAPGAGAPPLVRGADLVPKLFWYALRTPRLRELAGRFGAGVDVVLRATVTSLESRSVDGGRTVTAAHGVDHEGRTFAVEAGRFVLAAGGIENSRLLLSSDAGGRALGNEHDQVGRGFMNHPKGFAGHIRLHRGSRDLRPYIDYRAGDHYEYVGFRLSPEVQRRERLLNSYVGFEPAFDEGRLGGVDRWRASLHGGGRAARLLQPRLGPLWDLVRPPHRVVGLRWFTDMEPRPENRVQLGQARDAHGSRVAAVHHTLGPREQATFRALWDRLRDGVAAGGVGTLVGTPDDVEATIRIDASHHLGGTRMGADPATSVVDADCRVHAVSNLFVAGGSVFATGGCANPTYTIAALTLRLAAHLTGAPRHSSAPGAGAAAS